MQRGADYGIGLTLRLFEGGPLHYAWVTDDTMLLTIAELRTKMLNVAALLRTFVP